MTAKECLEPYFLRKPPDDSRYKERLAEEFTLVDRFGFTKVFQQVHEIIQIARSLNIPHIIRGSAGSSLLCFLMGITEIDPILYKLELARFMNSGRQDLPDIDIDVPYNRRDELYDCIAKRWPKMVARISNHVLYTNKVALRETAKEHYKEQISPIHALRSPQEKAILKSLSRKRFSLDRAFPDAKQKEQVNEEAEEKLGTLRHYSKHCGGIVIFEQEGEVPKSLRLNTTGRLDQIRLNKDETEDAGYIKIDILSNRGLAQLVSTQLQPKGLLDYPQRDHATEKLLAQGDNLGLTFGESRGMRKLFLSMKPRHMDDLAILLALIRPAAATRGRKREFLERWRYGAETPKDPLHQQIIFDDDAIAIIQYAIQCDSAEADKWRKVFAKGNPVGRVQFRRLLQQNGHSRSIQDYLLSELDYLALYSFCKSHAVSYAQLLWALAYEKAHNTHRFWMSALNHCHGEYRKWVHYREARCSGLLLTREPPPYRLTAKNGQPALISVKSQGEQLLLTQMFAQQQTPPGNQDIRDMRQHGYWLSEEFLPNCGVWMESQQRLDGWLQGNTTVKRSVKFRGLIATSRILRRDGLVTLITIGVANRRYIDIVVPDVDRSDVFSYVGVEGSGFYEKQGLCETIEVQKLRGVSLKTLQKLTGST